MNANGGTRPAEFVPAVEIGLDESGNVVVNLNVNDPALALLLIERAKARIVSSAKFGPGSGLVIATSLPGGKQGR